MISIFPVKLTAKKIHYPKSLVAGPFKVMKIDQFGNTGKLGPGATGQDRVGVVPDGTDIHGGNFAADEDGGHPEKTVVVQPGSKMLKSR